MINKLRHINSLHESKSPELVVEQVNVMTKYVGVHHIRGGALISYEHYDDLYDVILEHMTTIKEQLDGVKIEVTSQDITFYLEQNTTIDDWSPEMIKSIEDDVYYDFVIREGSYLPNKTCIQKSVVKHFTDKGLKATDVGDFTIKLSL